MMRSRAALVLVPVAALAIACTPHTRIVHADVGGAGVDAHVESMDAFTPPSPDAAGSDAFVPPSADAGRDAFTPPGIDAGHDAFVTSDSGGCAPLPTATPLVLHGTIASGPTYARPTVACGAPSTVGTAVFYATHVLCNTGATRSFSFELDAAASGGITDPFLMVYTGAGDVSTLTCLASDDDGAGVGNNSLATASVPAGATITVVPSTFDNGDVGDYVLTITPM